ncbi:MAG: hypothetical protein ACYDGW_08670 [Vulcanimicrobiaceae bacterium]
MNTKCLSSAAFALAAIFALGAGPASASPKPTPAPIRIPIPKNKMHSDFTVEVNHLGQVVRVTSGDWSHSAHFNHITYGNVLQAFIRRPDGTAVVGVYRISYTYDPRTTHIYRSVVLLKRGGNWGNLPGAVEQMIAKQRARERLAAQRRAAKLPTLKQILGPTPKPTHAPS